MINALISKTTALKNANHADKRFAPTAPSQLSNADARKYATTAKNQLSSAFANKNKLATFAKDQPGNANATNLLPTRLHHMNVRNLDSKPHHHAAATKKRSHFALNSKLISATNAKDQPSIADAKSWTSATGAKSQLLNAFANKNVKDASNQNATANAERIY